MAKKKNRLTNVFKFQKYLEIGSPDAETDKLLEQAFIEKDALNAIIDMSNQRSILIGRTGSGKSAILKHLEKTQSKVVRIEPEAMSLRFLSNSTLLQYFNSIDVNLNFFYKILWKHVFIIELLRLFFSYDEKKKDNWFFNIKDKFIKKSNPKRDKAFEYFDKWSNEFWIDTEKRIKEIETIVKNKFETDLGVNVSSLSAKSHQATDEQNSVRAEFKTKAEHIISEVLANDIHEIIKIVQEELFIDSHQKYFIIIDDLDKEWISSDMRYELIGAMIEVIKEFQSLKGVKIVISLRDNLYQLVFSGMNHKGGQREKFKPLYAELSWSALELKELLNKRLYLATNSHHDLKSVFEKTNRKGVDGFTYMLERTFYRPRDVISFVNHAIENSNNRTHFTLDIIKKAEIDYSNDRLIALEDEWGENYGDISRILRFLYGKTNGFNVKNIKEEDFSFVYFDENLPLSYKGDLLTYSAKWQTGEIEFTTFIYNLLYIFYTIGAIGLKKDTEFPIQFVYEKNISLSLNDIGPNTKVYVHKAFFAALKINTKALEPEIFN